MYSLNKNINSDSAFLIKRSLIENRLEPKFYTKKYINNVIKIGNSILPVLNLSEVTTLISDGTHFTPNYLNNGVKFISVKDVRKSKISLNKTKFISLEEAEKLDRRCKPQINDVLLTKIGATFGFAATVNTNERFQIFVSLALLRPNDKILPKYLEIFLNSNLAYIQYERAIKGAGVPDLHLEDIRKIKIPLPNIAEQQKIITLYENAYNEKQLKEEQAKSLLESIDNYLLKELGITLPIKDNTFSNRIFEVNWSELSGDRFDAVSNQSKELLNVLLNGKYSVSKLSRLVHKVKTGTTPHNSLNPYTNEGIPFLRNTNLQNGNLRLENIKFIREELAENLTYSNKNDLIVCIAGTVGNSVINDSEIPLAINQNITALEINQSKVNIEYLNYFFNTNLNFELVKRLCSIATIMYLNNTNLLSLNIAIPPLEKQNEIAIHIRNIRKRAEELDLEAKYVLKQAKSKIEKMILG